MENVTSLAGLSSHVMVYSNVEIDPIAFNNLSDRLGVEQICRGVFYQRGLQMIQATGGVGRVLSVWDFFDRFTDNRGLIDVEKSIMMRWYAEVFRACGPSGRCAGRCGSGTRREDRWARCQDRGFRPDHHSADSNN